MKQRITGKLTLFSVLVSVFVLTTPGLALAHVVVTPNEALTGAYETFTTSVPNEKDIPVTGIRLVIPESIESVTPTVKQGWEIQTKKAGEKVTEITWTGGTIPPELRDTFTFSAHLSENEGDINWRAYQTYQDGTVVSWDQQPSKDGHGHSSEDESRGPYSTTTVTKDTEEVAEVQNDSSNTILYMISVSALVVAVTALVRTAKK